MIYIFFCKLAASLQQSWWIGLITGIIGIFAPIAMLVQWVFIFVSIDFVTGVWASYRRAKQRGDNWAFQSERAWQTVIKFVFISAGIYLTWGLDFHILPFLHLNLANFFTAFVCGVELWSFLENAAQISNHPIFRKLQKYMKNKIDKAINE